MIVRPKPSTLELVYVMRGSIVPLILWEVFAATALSLGVVWLHKLHPDAFPAVAGAPISLFGIALSVFLGFRNNACYDRWWEARRQWGELVSLARNLARQTRLLEAQGHEDKRRQLLDGVRLFTFSLLDQLRPDNGLKTRSITPDADLAAQLAASRNRTDFLTQRLARMLADWNAQGILSDMHFQTLDRTLGGMGLVQAACERIASTPVPYAYTLLLHRTAWLFCLLLPFGFADTLGWFTPLATALAAYAFFGLDALGDMLEAPFAGHHHALPIEAMATTIDINLREAMGEQNLPPLPLAVDHVLM